MDAVRFIHTVYKDYNRQCRKLIWAKNKYDIILMYTLAAVVAMFFAFMVVDSAKNAASVFGFLNQIFDLGIQKNVVLVFNFFDLFIVRFVGFIVISIVTTIYLSPVMIKIFVVGDMWWKLHAIKYRHIMTMVEFRLMDHVSVRSTEEVAAMFANIQQSSRATRKFNILLNEILRSEKLHS